MRPRTAFDRRSALRLAAGFGIVGLMAQASQDQSTAWASHAHDLKAISISWLDYADPNGSVLGRIRPNVMLDISNHDGLVTPEGQHDLWLHVSVRNTGAADLVVEPDAFALWTTAGYLHRPLEDRPRGYTGNVLDDFHHGERHLVRGSGALPLTGEPIAPRTERSGHMLFRVPVDAWLAGLLFTPEPERMLMLASIPPNAGSIIID